MTNKTDKGRNDRGKILSFSQDHTFFAKLGDAKRAQNDPLSAVSRYNNALAMEPHDLDTRLAAAEVLTDMGRFSQSNRVVIPYMHEDEDFKREAFCLVGFNLFGLCEYEGARNCFNRFFDMTDEVSERTDAILDALDYIDSLGEDEPSLQDAAVRAFEKKSRDAQTALDKGDFESSAKLFKELVKEKPDDQILLYELALSYLCMNKKRESEICVDKLLAADDNNWPAWSMKLLFARDRKNELELKKICNKLEKCESNDPTELFRINGSLLEAGCLELAQSFAERLVRVLPYDTLANHRLAVCFVRQKQYRKAAEIYGKLLKIDPKDPIAAYFRRECAEADKNADSTLYKEFNMPHYQLPIERVIEMVKDVLDSRRITREEIVDRWKNDESFRSVIRWSFTLHEFNVGYSVLNLLRIIGDEDAVLTIREVMSDIDAGRALVNEAMGALKRCEAPEPYFAMLDGNLIEGRVNLVSYDELKVPKNYTDILKRFRDSASERYSAEIVSAGGAIFERFIASMRGSFPAISVNQSIAMTAAVEYLACDQCGATVSEDVLDRYGVTQRRLMNAIDRIVSSVLADMAPKADGEGEPE